MGKMLFVKVYVKSVFHHLHVISFCLRNGSGHISYNHTTLLSYDTWNIYHMLRQLGEENLLEGVAKYFHPPSPFTTPPYLPPPHLGFTNHTGNFYPPRVSLKEQSVTLTTSFLDNNWKIITKKRLFLKFQRIPIFVYKLCMIYALVLLHRLLCLNKFSDKRISVKIALI